MIPLRRTYTFRPEIGSAPCGDAPGMLGMEACLWTEHIADGEKLEAMLFPRAFAAAARAWGEDGKDYPSFLRRLEKVVRLAERDGVRVREREGWDPAGRSRREETFAFLRTMLGGMRKGDGEGAGGQGYAPRFLLAFFRRFLKPADLLFVRRLFASQGVKR